MSILRWFLVCLTLAAIPSAAGAMDDGPARPTQAPGRMFWFIRNRLSGSYFALRRASRS